MCFSPKPDPNWDRQSAKQRGTEREMILGGKLYIRTTEDWFLPRTEAITTVCVERIVLHVQRDQR